MRVQNQEGLNTQDVQYFKKYQQRHYGCHKKLPTSICWNLDGSLFLSAQSIIKIWNFNQQLGLQKPTQIMKSGHQNIIDYASFCNKNVFGTMSRQCLRIWDARQIKNIQCKQKIQKIKKQKSFDFLRFQWSHMQNNIQGAKISLISKDGNVYIYDNRNLNQHIYQINPPKNNSSVQYTAALWDNSNSVLFVVGGQTNSGIIYLYDGQSFSDMAQPLVTHCGRITDLAFTRDSQKFATASQDSLIQIHSIPQIICQRVFSSKTDSIYQRISFSCDGNYVAASSDMTGIDIFNVKKGGQAYKIKSSSAQRLLQWHPRKKLLAYVDYSDNQRKSFDKNEEKYIHLFYQ